MKRIFSAVIVMLLLLSSVGYAANSTLVNQFTVTAVIVDEDGDEIEWSSINVGDSFYLNYYVSNYPDLISGIEIDIAFDDEVIAYNDYLDSEQVIGKKGAKLSLSVDNTSYGISVTYLGTDVNTSSYSFDPEKYLTSIEFQKVADANTTITTSLFDFCDTNVDTYKASNLPTVVLGSAAPEPSEDGEVTVGSAASFATVDGTAVGSKAILGATGGEYGSAFRITFTRPEGATDNGVIFGIDLDGTKVFAPKQANLLAGVSANSAVTVDVSFLNGSTASGKAGVIEPQNITGISVILSDGAGKFFYSDSTDKAHKAPIAE